MEQEQKWIRAIVKRQSRDAADQLVRAYYDEIYVYFYKKTENREDALDLTQECFISMLRHLSAYDPKQAGFRTWLYRIAMHKAADFWRKKGRAEFVELDEEAAFTTADEDLSELFAKKELLEKVKDKAERLEEPERTIVRLYILERVHFGTIAERLQQSEARIKSRFYRAMKKMREELEHEGWK